MPNSRKKLTKNWELLPNHSLCLNPIAKHSSMQISSFLWQCTDVCDNVFVTTVFCCFEIYPLFINLFLWWNFLSFYSPIRFDLTSFHLLNLVLSQWCFNQILSEVEAYEEVGPPQGTYFLGTWLCLCPFLCPRALAFSCVLQSKPSFKIITPRTPQEQVP